MMTQIFDENMLKFLVCPLTKSPLRYDKEAQELISDTARLAYPIRDGIPIMLIEEARSLGAPKTKTSDTSQNSRMAS